MLAAEARGPGWSILHSPSLALLTCPSRPGASASPIPVSTLVLAPSKHPGQGQVAVTDCWWQGTFLP